MNTYAWLSLSASLVTALLGIVVYFLNRKRLLNKLFFLTALFGLYWTFTEFMMWQSSNAEIADFWNDLGFLWPFFVVLVFHFALLYTNNRWLKNKLTYIILYAPAVIFAIIDFSTDLINGTPVLEYWGYEDTSPATLAYNVSTVWVSLLPILALIVCLKFYLTTKEERKKQESKFVTIGFSIPIITYILTNVAFPTIDISIPNLGHFATLFFGIFVGYAIMKYELFTLDAAMAAENIMLTIPDPLFLADIKGKILRLNQRLVDLVGFEETELIGENLSKICVETHRCAEVIEALPKERTITNHELKLKTKEGLTKTVLFSGSVVHSKTGRDIGIACVLRDITERIEMEKRLVKAERLASIGELAGQIGHDLRNPLTGIKTGVYYLQKKANKLTDTERDSTIATINNAIEDSNRIINSLVDYASELHLKTEKCTPKSLLLAALSKINVPESVTIIDNTNAELELNLDVTEIEQVFTCMIKNAIEAIPEKGTVEISCIRKGESVELRFTDSGKGIPETIWPRMFSPLVTTKAKGMGMSLANCKRIVEAHGGKISFESVEGSGTTFFVTLPMKTEVQFIVDVSWDKNKALI